MWPREESSFLAVWVQFPLIEFSSSSAILVNLFRVCWFVTLFLLLSSCFSSCLARWYIPIWINLFGLGFCFPLYESSTLDARLCRWRFFMSVFQVNHSPSFATDSALDKKVKFEVIRDALRLVGISSKNRKRCVDTAAHAHQTLFSRRKARKKKN